MKDNIPEQQIDFSSSPPFSIVAWKNQFWHGIANYAPWCSGAFFIFVGLAVLAEKKDIQHVPAIFFTALLCILTMIPLKKLGKTVVSFGIDSKTDIFWIKSKTFLAYEKNAHRVSEFGFQKQISSKINPVWRIGSPQPIIFWKAKWVFTYKRSDNDYFWEFKGVSFTTEKDAQKAVKVANELLKLYIMKNPIKKTTNN